MLVNVIISPPSSLFVTMVAVPARLYQLEPGIAASWVPVQCVSGDLAASQV